MCTTLRNECYKYFVVVTRTFKMVFTSRKGNHGVKDNQEYNYIQKKANTIQAQKSNILKESKENHKQSPVEELTKKYRKGHLNSKDCATSIHNSSSIFSMSREEK